MPSQNYDYIRERYGKNVGKGTRVRIADRPDCGEDRGKTGMVVGASHYIFVRLDGQPESRYEPWHPGDIEVL